MPADLCSVRHSPLLFLELRYSKSWFCSTLRHSDHFHRHSLHLEPTLRESGCGSVLKCTHPSDYAFGVFPRKSSAGTCQHHSRSRSTLRQVLEPLKNRVLCMRRVIVAKRTDSSGNVRPFRGRESEITSNKELRSSTIAVHTET